jgi:hypothetical protein
VEKKICLTRAFKYQLSLKYTSTKNLIGSNLSGVCLKQLRTRQCPGLIVNPSILLA